MLQLPFGRTGITVSRLALGTVELGLDYGIGAGARRPPYEEAARILHRALDVGVNLIDTARAYGEAEAIIGRALAGRRRDFLLCTKVQPSGDARASVETSLRLLGTSDLDMVMVHCRAEDIEPAPVVSEVLFRLREAGVTRLVGASVYCEEAARAAIRQGFDCLQLAHSMLDRRPEAGLLAEAKAHGVGVVARSVLLKGVLSERAAQLPRELARLAEAARALGPLHRLPELAYRYLLAGHPPEALLVGAGRVEEVDAAARFVSLGPLSHDELAAIRARPLLEEALLNPARWPPLV